jgi:hypothetical protein
LVGLVDIANMPGLKAEDVAARRKSLSEFYLKYCGTLANCQEPDEDRVAVKVSQQ